MSTARNEHTGALIKTKMGNSKYSSGWDAIFGKKEPAVEPREITDEDRFVGAMVGLAVGDAIGTTVEFMPRGSFEPLTDMVGGGPFRLEAGQWTDDTSLALCLAESYLHAGKNDPIDQLNRYVNWYRHGYMSANGKCFDIGNTTRYSLEKYEDTKHMFPGPVDDGGSGNGSLMRLVPAVLFAYPDMDKVLDYARDSSRTTHGSIKSVESCQLFADILCSVLDGLPKNELFASLEFRPQNLSVIEIASGAFLEKTIDEIKGTGYCIQSLEAALWCFFKTDNFNDCVLMAANLGDDADTTAAIAGQIAGAFYGIQGIREDWAKKIAMSEHIHELGKKLHKK